MSVALVAGGTVYLRTVFLNSQLYYPMRPHAETPAVVGLPFADVHFQTEDEETLHGWWVPASTQPPLAHVIYFHGNGGNIGGRVDKIRLLSDKGFDVFAFDYRGYGMSTGKPHEEGTYADARAALATVLKQDGVDAGRIVYVGESLGGAVAIALAVEKPPFGLILQSTFASVRDEARVHFPIIPNFIVPDVYPSIRRIAQVGCPVLLVHGDRDRIVPIEQGRALYAAAVEPKTFHQFDGVAHNDLLALVGEEYVELLRSWVQDLGSGS